MTSLLLPTTEGVHSREDGTSFRLEWIGTDRTIEPGWYWYNLYNDGTDIVEPEDQIGPYLTLANAALCAMANDPEEI